MEEDGVSNGGAPNPPPESYTTSEDVSNPLWSNPNRSYAVQREKALGRFKGSAYWSSEERQYALKRQNALGRSKNIVKSTLDDLDHQDDDSNADFEVPEEFFENIKDDSPGDTETPKNRFSDAAKRIFKAYVEGAKAYGEQLAGKMEGKKKKDNEEDSVKPSITSSKDTVPRILNDIVSVLRAIDNTLKDQLKFDQDTFINSRLTEREGEIEQDQEKGKQRFGVGKFLKKSLINLVSPLGGLAVATITALFANLKNVIDNIKQKISSFIQTITGRKDREPGPIPTPSTNAPNLNAADGSFDVAYGYNKPPKPLTEMTIREVLSYQKNTLLPQAGSSAVGAYQINIATLEDFGPKVLGGNWLDQKFDPNNQFRIAEAIFKSSRGRDITSRWASLKGKVSPTQYQNKEFAEVERDIRLAEGTLRPGATPIDPPVQTANITPGVEPVTAAISASENDPLTNLMIMLKGMMNDGQAYYVEVGDTGKKTEAINTASTEIDNAINLGEKTKEAVAQEMEKTAALNSANRPESFLEAIDPNYRLGQNNIVSDYLMSFGMGRG